AALAAQADAYVQVVDACRRATNCHTVVVWGLSDLDSWIPAASLGILDHATLYDRDLEPKPAYDALVASLRAR
ncbi:MAG: endo-1,4-beta-xylanase, partial [Acidimicrobiales bacterium]